MTAFAPGNRPRMLVLAALVAASVVLLPFRAFAEDQPRRNVRLAVALGQGLLTPQLCSGCDRFWGRALAVGIELGWTIRPDLVVSLEEQAAVIHFADGTDGGLGNLQISTRYFWHPRASALIAAGFGVRAMDSAEEAFTGARSWSKLGPAVTVGAGYEPGRWGAWAIDVQARATAVFADGVAPGLLVLVGASWN